MHVLGPISTGSSGIVYVRHPYTFILNRCGQLPSCIIGVMTNDMTSDWFRTTVVVCQGCIFLFNIFLNEIVIADWNVLLTLSHIGGRHITALRFVDDIDLVPGSNDELADLM